ncbi:helix-turn-helix transcriptional regulator [Pseudomonas frederiksbergensis]|uniref:helix-turn-helix domain-containing protein n=1 Tax=Pseudomonas frederiksbergensis TaxID=104087 RepID=UPI00314543E6
MHVHCWQIGNEIKHLKDVHVAQISICFCIKTTRAIRGLSQKNLAEVSSRTYISKLERGQCSPTLEMMTALSVPLNLSPLTLIAMTIGTATGQSIKSLVSHVEKELAELHGDTLENLHLSPRKEQYRPQHSVRIRQSIKSAQQGEFQL